MASLSRLSHPRWALRSPDTDCLPDDELGTCGTPGNATVQECKAACFANPNCGGFNLCVNIPNIV